MNALAQNLATDESIENDVDRLGGGGPVESGAYPCTIAMAYLKNAESGAVAIAIHLKNGEGREIRQDFWVQSGNAKGNKTFYTNAQGEKKELPGFTLMNQLCRLTTTEDLSDIVARMEDKVVNLYSHDAGKEVATTVPVLVDLLDKPVIAGIVKQTVDKTAKGDDGQYHPTGDTRDENEVDKFFRASDGLTTAELRAGADEASFLGRWREKNDGVSRDRSTANKADKGTGPSGQSSAVGGGQAQPKKSLFA